MNSSTKISITIVICTVVAVALLVPEEKSRSISSSFKRLLGDSAELCKEHHKADFVNPDSVYFLSSELAGSRLTVRVSAATRGGGRGSKDLRCTIDSDGKIDISGTSSDNYIYELNGKTARLIKVNTCRREGGEKYACEALYPEPID